MYYIGLDVHKKTISYCVKNASGQATNSFCGGGKPGVSDTSGSALWVLDIHASLWRQPTPRANIDSGVNQLGFISWYSPIGDDEHGRYLARPEYYGMLAFAQAQRAQRVAISYDAAGLNLTAYAVLSGRNRLALVVINKDASRDASVTIAAEQHFVRANVLRLNYANTTTCATPFPDWYDPFGTFTGFSARPVMGAAYVLLLARHTTPVR